MAKKKTPNTTASKPAAKSTKGTGKKPAKTALPKPAKSPAIKAAAIRPARRPLAKPAKSPTKDTTVEVLTTASKQLAKPAKSPTTNTTIETAATTSGQIAEEVAKPEHAWVVWQDGRGIWVGTRQEFKNSKRPETIVCDVIDRGAHQVAAALHRAIQLAETLRQTYSNHMKSWLQYDDAAQRQRIQDWYERVGEK